MSAIQRFQISNIIPGFGRFIWGRSPLQTNSKVRKFFLVKNKFPLIDSCQKSLKLLTTTGFGLISSGILVRGGLVAWKHDDKKSSALIDEVDSLYNDQKFPILYEKLKSCMPTQDPEILWRLVRATYEMGRLPDLKNEAKIARLEEALEYATKAVECGPTSCPSHRWYAIALHKLAEAKGTKEKIEKAKVVREYMKKAVDIAPEDPNAHYLLGQWCYSVADITWYERKLANIIYGTPPEATYEEALEHFEIAEKVKPGFYSKNNLMLGKALIKVNQKDRGIEILKKLTVIIQKTADDKDAVKEAKEILNKHGIKS